MTSILKFSCPCGNKDPNEAKVYEGMLGYDAIVCKKCGRTHDYTGVHKANEWSREFVGLNKKVKVKKHKRK